MGRKRSFDIDEAIEIAMREFWLNGYEGTSISDLCDLIGIVKPSFYRAFNSKDALFQRALERYEKQHLQFVSHALDAQTTYDVARLLLQGLIRTVTQPLMPQGALDLNAGIACGPECETIRQKVIEWHSTYEKLLTERFLQAKRSGDLNDGISPQAVARYLMSVCAGIALQAKAGASRTALQEIGEIALLAIAAMSGSSKAGMGRAVTAIDAT